MSVHNGVRKIHPWCIYCILTAGSSRRFCMLTPGSSSGVCDNASIFISVGGLVEICITPIYSICISLSDSTICYFILSFCVGSSRGHICEEFVVAQI